MIRILNGWRVLLKKINHIILYNLSDETLGAILALVYAIFFAMVFTTIHLTFVFS